MNKKAIVAIGDFLESAEQSIKNAKKLLNNLSKEDDNIDINSISYDTRGLNGYTEMDNQIVEGIFNGEDMIGVDNNIYPVPANYASKSKLIEGDKLKLTIIPNGKMIYKQIGPIERESKSGLLAKEGDRYQAIADGKVYKLITASVTHFKGNIGDKITILLPKDTPTIFAAVDVITPKDEISI